MDELFGKTSKESVASQDFTIGNEFKVSNKNFETEGNYASGGKWSGGSSKLNEERGRSRRRGNAILEDSALDRPKTSVNNNDDIFERFVKPTETRTETEIEKPFNTQVFASTKNDNEGKHVVEADESRFGTTLTDMMSTDANNMLTIHDKKLMHEQSLQMQEFEKQQQEQFQRDLKDQRRILEMKQKEYTVSIFGFFETRNVINI